MNSFDELGLDDALVEALAAEGIEHPTAFQQAAIPVVRRGNNLVGLAGPGGGCLIAYGAALLDRIDAEGDPGRILVLSPTPEAAQRNAESVARLAMTTGHSVAALGSPWAVPERASVLFGTPADVLSAMKVSEIQMESVQALVVDGVAPILGLGQTDALEQVLECVPQDAQRVFLSAPMTKEATDLAERHVRKAVHLPPRRVDGQKTDGVRRGSVQYSIVSGDRMDSLLQRVAAAFEAEARHVLVFFSSDDKAADGGDFLALHGFGAGAPGAPDIPVWLGVDELAARGARTDSDDPDEIAVLSFDVPADPDSFDRRHGSAGGTVLVLPRELPHLRETATRAGYELRPATPGVPSDAVTELARQRDLIGDALESRNLAGALLILQPLFEVYSPAEVAAAVLTLYQDGAPPPVTPPSVPGMPAQTTLWTKLFVSVGSRDGVGPGDLVGAISGEAGVSGPQVGKIDIRDTYSLVDIDQTAAERVIKALNGTSIRGRAARVDVDRASRSGGRTARPQGRPATGRGSGRG